MRSNTDNKNCFSDDHESTVFLHSVKDFPEKWKNIRQITDHSVESTEFDSHDFLTENSVKSTYSKQWGNFIVFLSCHFNTFRGLDFDFFFCIFWRLKLKQIKNTNPLKIAKMAFFTFSNIDITFLRILDISNMEFFQKSMPQKSVAAQPGGQGGQLPPQLSEIVT